MWACIPGNSSTLDSTCIVSTCCYVRPNYLGDFKEFSNEFTEPIKAGQKRGASNENRKAMAMQLSILQDLTEVSSRREGVIFFKTNSKYIFYLS
jgi:hypothetical protein